MAPPFVIQNCCQLKIVWSGPSRTWLNVFGIRAPGAFPVIDQALADGIHATVGATISSSGLVSHLASTVVFERILLRSLNTPNQPEFSSAGTPISGAGGLEVLPLSIATCITLRTALAGKSFRGRTYISGFDEGQNTAAGRIATAANSAARLFVEQLSGNLGGSGFQLAVLSKPTDAKTIPAKTYGARAGQGNAVTAVIARDDRWDTQRRRTGRE